MDERTGGARDHAPSLEYAMRPSIGNVHGATTAFNRAGCAWVSAESALLTDLARGEWGFDGYFITDMASSNAASIMAYDDGVMAGTDLYLGAGRESALAEWAYSPTFCMRMREACHRILLRWSITARRWTE